MGVVLHVVPRGESRMFLLRCFLNTIKNRRSFSSEEIEKKLIKAVVIGAPNAGKSTLINALIGKKVTVL